MQRRLRNGPSILRRSWKVVGMGAAAFSLGAGLHALEATLRTGGCCSPGLVPSNVALSVVAIAPRNEAALLFLAYRLATG